MRKIPVNPVNLMIFRINFRCTDGGYVLRTSHTDWDCETIARTYWRLSEIEQTFRSMKSELGLRPIHHRAEAHLFLSVLAFHMAHLIRSSWGTLKVGAVIVRSGRYIKVRIAQSAVDAWKQFGDNFEKLKRKAETHIDLIRKSTTHLENIRVMGFECLIAQHAEHLGACALVRGLRSSRDFDYESQMAYMNRRMIPKLDTVFFHTDATHALTSSSLVRDILHWNGDIRPFVPEVIAEALTSQ